MQGRTGRTSPSRFISSRTRAMLRSICARCALMSSSSSSRMACVHNMPVQGVQNRATLQVFAEHDVGRPLRLLSGAKSLHAIMGACSAISAHVRSAFPSHSALSARRAGHTMHTSAQTYSMLATCCCLSAVCAQGQSEWLALHGKMARLLRRAPWEKCTSQGTGRLQPIVGQLQAAIRGVRAVLPA